MTEPKVTDSQFLVGSILKRGLGILFRNIVSFGLLSLVLISPPYIYQLAVDPQTYLGEPESTGLGPFAQIIVTLLTYLVTAALVYGTFQELRGRHASLSDCVSRGLAVMFPVIGVAFLVGLVIGLAMLLFVIPGLIVWTILWVAIPAAVVERPGVSASLRRSAELTKGYRWQIFGLIVITVVLTLVAAFVLGAIGGVVGAVVGIADLTLNMLAELMGTAVGTALSAVVVAVGYHDLRVVKEGVDVEQIAAVFD